MSDEPLSDAPLSDAPPPPPAADAPPPSPPADAPPPSDTLLLGAFLFLVSASLVAFELLLTRLFSLVLFAHLANLAIALALLGIGVGATALHLWPSLVPAERLSTRLGAIALGCGASLAVAVEATLKLRLTDPWDYTSSSIRDWNSRAGELVHHGALVALIPFLMAPFVFGGVGFSAVFQHARDRIGRLYAADLWGGAAGGVLFIPLLAVLSGPDTVLVSILACAVAGFLLFRHAKRRAGAALALVMALAALAGLGVSAAHVREVFRVRSTAGWSENDILYTDWTPEARVAILDNKQRRQELIVLDTSSASEVIRTTARLQQIVRTPDRGLVYMLQKDDAAHKRVAIIAAAAGNEVMVAQHYGFRDVTALDIVRQMHDLVRDRYRAVPGNPYRQPGVRFLAMDGRAGIVHSARRYDVIQMRWANLNNAAGVLSNAWSPALLETKEAFRDYFDHLRPGGLVSFAKGADSRRMLRTAAAALRERGVRYPYQCMALVSSGQSQVFLVGKRPFTRTEWRRLKTTAAEIRARIVMGPSKNTPRRLNAGVSVLTDDRPYPDRPADLLAGLYALWSSEKLAFATASGASRRVNKLLWVQAIALVTAGLLFVGVPLLSRGRRDLRGLQGRGRVLVYAGALGYGYLAIETVLIHDLVLFVGHPTFAVTLVILAMLLGSGFGSAWVGSMPAERLPRRLPGVLFIVIAVGLVQALALPPLYAKVLVGAPTWLRVAVVGTSLLPLGIVMGMPFPMAMRILPKSAGEIVPWCWALNGWMSVVAAMSTVFAARQLGYTEAFFIATVVYCLALALAPGLARVGPRSAP